MGREMEELMEMICRELDEIAQKGEMSAGDLDTVYKLIVAKEKLMKIEQIEGESRYSRSGSSNSRRNSYDDSFDGGNSMRRSYARGRYSRYSGDDGVRDKLMEIMESNELNSQQKQTLKKMMEDF